MHYIREKQLDGSYKYRKVGALEFTLHEIQREQAALMQERKSGVCVIAGKHFVYSLFSN